MAKYEIVAKEIDVKHVKLRNGGTAFQAEAKLVVLRPTEPAVEGEPDVRVTFRGKGWEDNVMSAMASAMGKARDLYYDLLGEERDR